MKHLFFLSISFLFVCSCANQKAITGGPRDETPPKIVQTIPENGSTNFDQKVIKLFLNENIELNRPEQQISITPLLEKSIRVFRKKGKIVEIHLNNKLETATTYTLFFDEVIRDVSERNPLPPYELVFSTGDKIDSLNIFGEVYLPKGAVRGYKTMLLTETQDFLAPKSRPIAMKSLQKSSTYAFNNLRDATYQVLVFNDKNKNNKYDRFKEEVDWVGPVYNLTTNTMVKKVLFPQIELPHEIKIAKEKILSKHLYEIELNKKTLIDDVEILINEQKILSATTESFTVALLDGGDVSKIHIWDKYFDGDKLSVKIIEGVHSDTANFLKGSKEVEYKTNLISLNREQVISPNEKLIFRYDMPIKEVLKNNIEITENDKVFEVKDFTVTVEESFFITLDFPLRKEKNYRMVFYPEAIVDQVDIANTRTFTIEKRTYSDRELGDIFLTVNIEETELKNIMLLRVREKRTDKFIKQVYLSELDESNKIELKGLYNGEFEVNILYDKNKNQQWDSANTEKKIKGEKIWFYENTIKLRPNWQAEENIKIPVFQ